MLNKENRLNCMKKIGEIPNKIAAKGLPSVLGVILIRTAILLASEFILKEGTCARIVERVRFIHYPFSGEQVTLTCSFGFVMKKQKNHNM